jgi:hypothetical protein
MRWVIAQLVIIAAGVAVFVYLILPSHPGALIGGFLLAIGLLQIISYRSGGRRFFAKTQSAWHHVAKFWARSGEHGTQLLLLGVGIILAVAGCVLIVAGFLM